MNITGVTIEDRDADRNGFWLGAGEMP